MFGFLANAGEAIVEGGLPGIGFWPGVGLWLGFGSICLGLAAYGLWCGWLRVRKRTLPEERGFPVGR